MSPPHLDFSFCGHVISFPYPLLVFFFFFNVLGLIPLFYYLSLEPTMKFPKVEIFKAIPTQYYIDQHQITFAYTPPTYSKVLLNLFFLSLNTCPLRLQFDTRIPLVPMLQVPLSTHI